MFDLAGLASIAANRSETQTLYLKRDYDRPMGPSSERCVNGVSLAIALYTNLIARN